MSAGLTLILYFFGTLNAIAYLIAIIITGTAFTKYKYVGHAWMTISFVVLLISNVLRMASQLLVMQQYLFEIWFLTNSFLMIGVWSLLLALLLSQYDRLPKRAHLITLLVGILVGLFASSDFVSIKKDAVGVNAQYHPAIGIFSMILLVIFIISVLRPMGIKLKKNPSYLKQGHFMILLVAYALIVMWALGVFFTSNSLIRTLRPLIFGIAMLCWAISLYLNPLSLTLTYTQVKYVIVTSTPGLPLVSLHVPSRKEMDTTTLTGILSAIKTSMESVIGSEKSLKTIIFQDSVLSFITGKHAILILVIDGQLSSNIELLGRIYLDEFESKYGNEIQKSHGVVKKELFLQEIDRILEIIDSITV